MPTISLLDKYRLLDAVACDPARSRIEIGIVACVLHCLDNNSGLARVGFERLSERTGASRSGVQRGIKNLKRDGILPVHRRGGSNKDGDRMANVYRPNLSYRPAHLQAAVDTYDVSGSTNSADATSSADAVDQKRRRTRPVASTLPLPSSLPGFNPEGEEEEVTPPPPGAVTAVGGAVDGGVTAGGHVHLERFDEFWSACPKREQRKQAMEAYRDVLASGVATPSVLIAAMQRYAIAKAHLTDPKYLKFPHNWLRGECWLEDPQPPKAKPKDLPKPKVDKQMAAVGKIAPQKTEKTHRTKTPAKRPIFAEHLAPSTPKKILKSEPTTEEPKKEPKTRLYMVGEIKNHFQFGDVKILERWTPDGRVDVKLRDGTIRTTYESLLTASKIPNWAFGE